MLTDFLENLIARLWNRSVGRRERQTQSRLGLRIGRGVIDGKPNSETTVLPDLLRQQHIVVLGRTGGGKSSLIYSFIEQDIASDTGFIVCDFHGDATVRILKRIALEERRRRTDLSAKVVVVNPADPDYAVGLNLLRSPNRRSAFVEIAEFAEILKTRWHLDSFGARTEELLRNTLSVLSDNGFTPIEIAPLLTNPAFRASCLQKVANREVRAYFEERYNTSSESMQKTLREPVLNKVSTFAADPSFRHLVGQQTSRFSLSDVLDSGHWVILNLNKGLLGEQALTIGSLLLAQLKHALFARRSRRTFAVYLDEVQNLVASENGLEVLLSESRKFGIQICTANQFLEQTPVAMRAALLACGSHIFFRLSNLDAEKAASALDGGRPLQELLKNLPQRQVVAKLGPDRWRHLEVFQVSDPQIDPTDLYHRSRERWATPRTQVEKEIRARVILQESPGEALDEWE